MKQTKIIIVVESGRWVYMEVRIFYFCVCVKFFMSCLKGMRFLCLSEGSMNKV